MLLSQEEMARLQGNLEKLKVQGSEDDSDEKVTLHKQTQRSVSVTFSSHIS